MNRIDVVTGGKPYSIVYNPDADELVVDGVRCSTEVIRMMIVEPKTSVWIKFERRHDGIHVEQSQELL